MAPARAGAILEAIGLPYIFLPGALGGTGFGPCLGDCGIAGLPASGFFGLFFFSIWLLLWKRPTTVGARYHTLRADLEY
jgi:hypothetical protein